MTAAGQPEAPAHETPSGRAGDGTGAEPAPERVLHALAAELRAEGRVIEAHVAEPPEQPALGLLAAAGPRCAAHPGAYALVVEAVREGYLCHYGEPRLLAAPDADLRLLIGDHLYARGIERLAGLGDPLAVRELADLISLAARVDAAPGGRDQAFEAAWLSTVVVIAAGPHPGHGPGKERLSDSGDALPLWNATREAAAKAGLSETLMSAAKQVGFSAVHLG